MASPAPRGVHKKRSRLPAGPLVPRPDATVISSAGPHLSGLRSFSPLADSVFHLLALQKRLEPVGLDVREMHEQVLASVVRRNEPESFLCVKPLHFTSAHCTTPSSLVLRNGYSLTSSRAFPLREREISPTKSKKSYFCASHSVNKILEETVHFLGSRGT